MKTTSNLLFAISGFCVLLALSVPVRTIFTEQAANSDVCSAALALGMCGAFIGFIGAVARGNI